jgi:hypothetical protein
MGKNKARKTSILLLIIVIFGLLLRLIFFSGMGISDSLVYSKTANDINEGKGIDPNSTLTLSTRLGLILPTALFYNLFGINDLSSVAFVLMTSIASIILIFYFGKLLFNDKIGLIAALLLSFFPLDVVYATRLNSDLPSVFFMAAGIYIFLYAEMKHKLKYGLSYLFTGILIGIGYLIRESVLLIALFFISYIIYKKKIKKEYFLVPLGVLMILMLEAFIFLSLTGNPIFRFTEPQKYLSEATTLHNYFGRLDFPIGLLHYPWLFLTNNLLLFFYITIFIAVLYLFLKRKKEISSILLWFIPLILYLSFGSASLTQYIPFRAVDRYTSIITIPGILILAFFLTRKDIVKKYIPILAIILLFSSSIWAISLHENRNILDNLKVIYKELESFDKIIYIDDRSLQALDYIARYKNNLDILGYPKELSKVRDVYIVINDHMIRNVKEANPKIKFPEEIENPPNRWKIVKEIGEIEEDKITVYYAP